MVCEKLLIFFSNDFKFILFKYFLKIAETRDIVVGLLRDARQRYPEMFNQIVANEPNAAQIINLL